MIQVESTDALIVVDVQNDFCCGGALAVPFAEQVIRPINSIQKLFDHLVFSRDWHPDDHCSFSDTPQFQDGSWPGHCISDTPGAEFHGDLRVPVDAVIVSKASDPERDAYSAFDGTGLAAELRRRGVQRVFVTGLALDYCVRATLLDALKEGLQAVLLKDAVRPVSPERTEEIQAELERAGATLSRSDCLS